MNLRLEELAMNAWPALSQVLYDGWVLRFAAGYTKRANSVNPLYGSTLDLERKVLQCEALYRAAGLPAVFRLTPFSPPAGLDRVLENRGYGRVDPSLVMYCPLEGAGARASGAAFRAVGCIDDWLTVHAILKGGPADPTHGEMLRRVVPEGLFAALSDGGRPVACGLGVMEEGWLGLFDIVTGAEYRRRGFGSALVRGMLAWAQARGARHAYLQVQGDNAPAIRLYEGLGFREAYSYWYRVAC